MIVIMHCVGASMCLGIPTPTQCSVQCTYICSYHEKPAITFIIILYSTEPSGKLRSLTFYLKSYLIPLNPKPIDYTDPTRNAVDYFINTN